MNDENAVTKIRREKIEKVRASGKNPYPNDFKPDSSVAEIFSGFDSLSADELGKLDKSFSVAGRIVAMRAFGKAGFIKIMERSGRIQAYLARDKLPDPDYASYQDADVGDIVAVTGRLFRTKTNELSIYATSFRILTKAIRPLPEKWHGLTDVEIRYRQRYVDLIVNPDVKNVFLTRAKIIQLIRNFFIARDYIEVETPMMQPVAGGALARPFVTRHNALGMDLFLRIAPELYLKRLVVGGLDRVFEINRNFRNEGISTQHNPEFTMLEFYEAYATYEELMTLTEELLHKLALEIFGKESFNYQGIELSFRRPFERLTMEDAIVKHGGVNRSVLDNRDKMIALLKESHIEVTGKEGKGRLIQMIFEDKVEKKLVQPTFIYAWPYETSPLARRNDQNPEIVDRFELMIFGREIANGFSELNDSEDQYQRFREQVEERKKGDDEAHPLDSDYVRALEYGLPPTAGEGIGIDRLVMILTDSPSIRDVILFPQLKKET